MADSARAEKSPLILKCELPDLILERASKGGGKGDIHD